MRASEFINEGVIDQYYEENKQVVLGAIQSKCRPYLQAIRGNMSMHRLWRGTHDHDHGVMIADGLWEYKVRTNRRPRDTAFNIHTFIDDAFLDMFGHRYRSNATFAVGDRVAVGEYGQGYLFIPIGNFEFLWSPVYYDLTKDFYAYFQNHPPGTKVDAALVRKFIDEGEYSQRNLIAAIDSRREIMFNCQSYYLLYEEAARLTPMDMVFK